MKKAKAEGQKYIPASLPFAADPIYSEFQQELKAEREEDDAKFALQKAEAGITDD